jgi:alpha-beta hydrolase superfamily lysophospholipase
MSGAVATGSIDSTTDPVLLPLENQPRSPEFVTNLRGQRLHLRTTWPDGAAPPRALILSFHGYGSHASRPTHRFLSARFASSGFAYAVLDFHGHGYSDGERGLVNAPEHLLDDALAAACALYAPADGPGHAVAHRAAPGTPLYLMGLSMGGGMALITACLLREGARAGLRSEFFEANRAELEARVMPAFRGTLLFCPVLRVAVRSAARSLLLAPLAALAGRASLPAFLLDENDYNHLSWASKDYIAYLTADGWPRNPDGLSYGGNIRFRTLETILALGDLARSCVPLVHFPFVVFHDEVDSTVKIEGTQHLMAEAPSAAKTFVPVVGGLHDIHANKPGAAAAGALEWLETQMR